MSGVFLVLTMFREVDEGRLFYGSGGTAISKTLLLRPIVLSRAFEALRHPTFKFKPALLKL
jgi:hypothetical protein